MCTRVRGRALTALRWLALLAVIGLVVAFVREMERRGRPAYVVTWAP